MKLKEICKKTGVSKRNVHFYIKEGILNPSVNPDNGYYEFSEGDYQKLVFVRQMRNAGLSLSNIRSLIHTPLTASHYLNQYVNQLKQEQRHIEQTLISLNHILSELPIHPDFPALYSLCIESGIPEKPKDLAAEDMNDYHNITTINRYLWAAFLPQTKFTDYQEFLWAKVNRLTLEHPTEDYQRLRNFLNNLPSAQFDQLFSQQSERYSYMSSLKPDEYKDCSREMIVYLKEGIKNPRNVQFWKQYYADFFYPTVMLHDSEFSRIIMELSPFYREYVFNIGNVCKMTYQYLLSDEGSDLYRQLKNTYGDNLQLETANHGMLEGLVNLSDFSEQMILTD